MQRGSFGSQKTRDARSVRVWSDFNASKTKLISIRCYNSRASTQYLALFRVPRMLKCVRHSAEWICQCQQAYFQLFCVACRTMKVVEVE